MGANVATEPEPSRIWRWIGPIAALAVFGGVAYVLHREIANLHIRDIFHELRSIPTINIATAILTEATLSFLGVGVPPTQPSLGTLIRIGNDFLFSGEWWITVFPGAALVILVLSINVLGDWLRDALNPRLR